MNEMVIDPNMSDEEIFNCNLSDTALENAATVGRENVRQLHYLSVPVLTLVQHNISHRSPLSGQLRAMMF
jgi:hypothetical protein